MKYPLSNLFLLIILESFKSTSCVSSGRRRLDDTAESEIHDDTHELKYRTSRSWNVTRSFGQITAVAINAKHNVVIFHRGPHVWNGESFNDNNEYAGSRDSPIAEETISELDPITGLELRKWGDKFFFLPHGLSFDSEGNYWLTDVAMHQVFKFAPDGGRTPLLVLGQAFTPGSSNNQFCKPTSVAVHSETKEVYVADGYCNSRLMKFSLKGEYLTHWGHGGPASRQRPMDGFDIPHKVILVEHRNKACISDREHGQIKCLDIKDDKSNPIVISQPHEWSRLFSISFSRCEPIDMLFAVTGPSFSPSEPGPPVMAYGVSFKDQKIMTKMAPQGSSGRIPTFSNPHDIVSTSDCKNVYVVEIGPNVIWKFMTNFFGPNPDSKNVTLISGNMNYGETHNVHSQFLGSFTFMISAFSLVVIVIVFLLRRPKHSRYNLSVNFLRRGMSNSRDSFDLGRLLEDPEKSGFNRVSTHETDADFDGDQSDSEVEEFNVSNVRNGLKV